MLSRVRAIVGAGIPVMGHRAHPAVRNHARRLQGAGQIGPEGARAPLRLAGSRGGEYFSLVLEAVPAPVARRVSERLAIPDQDRRRGGLRRAGRHRLARALGLYEERVARFVKRYAEVGEIVRAALAEYAADVRARRFPEERHTYAMPEAELALFEQALETTPEAEAWL